MSESYDLSIRYYKYISKEQFAYYNSDLIENNTQKINMKNVIHEAMNDLRCLEQENKLQDKEMEGKLEEIRREIEGMIKITNIDVKMNKELDLIRVEFYSLNPVDQNFVCFCDLDVQDSKIYCQRVFPDVENSFLDIKQLSVDGNLSKFVKSVRKKFVGYLKNLIKNN